MSKTLQQLPLEFTHRPCLNKEDFLVAKCNIEAVQMVDSWPEWNFFALCIYGAEGCGKTHLANVFSHNVSALTNYPYRIPCIKAKDVTLESPHKLFAQHRCMIVEELCNEMDNEAMFHLYNLYRNEDGFILFTSNTAPARLDIKLPDLRSRLNIVPAVEIKEPDDDLLSALIVKLFMDRQVMVTPEIVAYIVQNMQRSFAYARKLVTEIDNISLARKRGITIPLVKEAIAYLADDHQGNLF